MNSLDQKSLWLRLFLPFAGGYFLSYLYRTVNAVIGPVLAHDLALADNSLGLLTSTYFLAFGLAQLPIGMLLDRIGPRRVEAGLMLIAAAGAAVFARSDSLLGLASGRAMIGLGVSACLMASLKAFNQWYPLERQASLTGLMMASGGLGALAAAKPLELVLTVVSWRELAFALALATMLVAGLIWLYVPDKVSEGRSSSLAEQLDGVRTVFASPYFWRFAPMAFFLTGGFMAVQGIWASRWMIVLEGMDRSAVALRLTWMSAATLGGFLFMGFFATALVRRGVRLEKIYVGAMLAAFVCFILVASQPTLAGNLIWPVLSAAFSLSNISYSLVAKAFPSALSGRANTAVNVMVFAGAFSLQWGIGLFVDGLQALGWTDGAAYRAAFFALSSGQFLALCWLLRPGWRT